jgi:ribosome-binding factor A
MDANRLKKVEGQVQKDLAEIFRQLAQEKFQGVLFTVSTVRITADLSIAHVNLSLFPVKDKALIIDWCNQHKNLIKDRLVKRFEGKLRKMPELYFHLDEAIDAQAEIDKILREGGDSPIK